MRRKLSKNLKMMINTRYLLFLFLAATLTGKAQSPEVWNGRQCAVVLTYDDAIDADLDNVVPALDSMGFRGTFYIIGSSPVVSRRMGEWRKAAQEGHELGNHALFIPATEANRAAVSYRRISI